MIITSLLVVKIDTEYLPIFPLKVWQSIKNSDRVHIFPTNIQSKQEISLG